MLPLIVASAGIDWSSVSPVDLPLARCVFSTCLAFSSENRLEDCANCFMDMDYTAGTVGVNGIPFGYFFNAARVGSGIQSYADAWCPQGLANNCNSKMNFWGPGSESILGWDNVARASREMINKTWTGELWRGNELGFLIMNPVFWAECALALEPRLRRMKPTPLQPMVELR